MTLDKPFKFYDVRIAENYESHRKNDSWWIWEDRILLEFISTLNENECLLDAPSGTGRVLDLISHNGKDRNKIRINTYLLDGALSMIKESLNKKSRENIGGLICADLENMPIKKKVFDSTICFRLFHLLNHSEVETIFKNLLLCSKNKMLLQIFHLEYDKYHLMKTNVKLKILKKKSMFSKILVTLLSDLQYIKYILKLNHTISAINGYFVKKKLNVNYVDQIYSHKFTFIEEIIKNNDFKIVKIDKFIEANLRFNPIYVTSVLWIERIEN